MRLLKFRLNKTELSGNRVESDQSPVVALSNLAPPLDHQTALAK